MGALYGLYPSGRQPQCTVQDQANAICFLASDEAAGITGQVLTVDHDMTI